MEELFSALCSTSMKKVIESRKLVFTNTQIDEWLEKLKERREEVHVEDVESVHQFLKDFKARFKGKSIYTDDIRLSIPNIGGVLQHILRPPNNLQFAIAQVAHNLLGMYQR